MSGKVALLLLRFKLEGAYNWIFNKSESVHLFLSVMSVMSVVSLNKS
jgi:hypothetical protein